MLEIQTKKWNIHTNKQKQLLSYWDLWSLQEIKNSDQILLFSLLIFY